jgi:hypothetical protein
MNTVPVILQLICGVVGGNLICAGFKDLSLGPIGNSLAGLLGGGIFGHFLHTMTGVGGNSSDLQIFLTSLLGGLSGGAVMTILVGWVKGMISRRP